MKLRVIGIALMCICLLGGLTYQSMAAIDPGTIEGLWLFEDGGGDIAKDSSGNGLDGDLIDGPAWVAGKFGGGLEFDGVGSHVVIPDHASPNDALTITAWAKSATETWNQHGWIMEKRDAYILHCNADSTNVAFPISNGAPWNQPHSWDTGSVGPEDITEWHMYTGTFDSATGEWKIYIDGELASELEVNPDPLIEDVGPLYIGNDTWCAGRFGAGTVDEVAVLSVALSEGDIKDLYNNGFAAVGAAVEATGKLVTTWADIKD